MYCEIGNDDNIRIELHKNSKHMIPISMDILVPSFIDYDISVNDETRIIARKSFLRSYNCGKY